MKDFEKKLDEALDKKWEVVLRNRSITDRTKLDFSTNEELDHILNKLKK